MPITIDGKLTYGLEMDGVFHKDFTMRVPTLEEVETALEDAGPDACSARVARYKWLMIFIDWRQLPALTDALSLTSGVPVGYTLTPPSRLKSST